MPIIKIGSRKSRLATIQSEFVQHKLQGFLASEWKVEIVFFDTKGDQVLDKALHKVGDKGLFTAELEGALASGDIDLAVHSLKDLPTAANAELPIVAISERESPSDCVIFSNRFKEVTDIFDLPQGSKIGTSSLRREAQLKHLRPDFEVMPIRGNVETRIRKVEQAEGGLAAGLLAEAGINRLKLHHHMGQILKPQSFIPAPGQGALAIQSSQKVLEDKPALHKALLQIHHPETALTTNLERKLLNSIDGGCQTPFGAYVKALENNKVEIYTVLGLNTEGNKTNNNYCFYKSLQNLPIEDIDTEMENLTTELRNKKEL
ncbi:MAG TPA: hydroxymethylbilane synthase [Vampirovibrionales bacterium]